MINSRKNRASGYGQLGDHVRAIEDWDKVLELCEPKDRPFFRAERLTPYLRSGRIVDAVTEVADLTVLSSDGSAARKWHPMHWYEFACVYAVASHKLSDRKQEHADLAMGMLRQAVDAGYRDGAKMEKDENLAALRDRADFKALAAELVKSSQPNP